LFRTQPSTSQVGLGLFLFASLSEKLARQGRVSIKTFAGLAGKIQ
jgi:hypothetical protein